jgi:hypothetical protein
MVHMAFMAMYFLGITTILQSYLFGKQYFKIYSIHLIIINKDRPITLQACKNMLIFEIYCSIGREKYSFCRILRCSAVPEGK